MTARTVASRLRWAVEMLAVGPDDRVLEVGCGHGVAVTAICERLVGGRVIAIDRSAALIARAERRNRWHVAAGRALFRATTLAEADFGGARLDKIFAVNVGLFWRQPARELDLIGRLLRPGGTLSLFHQPPSWPQAGAPQGFADALASILRDAGFSVERVAVQEGEAVPTACVIAKLA